MIEEIEVAGIPKPTPETLEYRCDRCGYKYNKRDPDAPPFLCYRCIRFIAKRVWVIINTIQPAISRPAQPEL